MSNSLASVPIDGTATIVTDQSVSALEQDPRLPAPGMSGQVLTSTGTIWQSQAPGVGNTPAPIAQNQVLVADAGLNWVAQAQVPAVSVADLDTTKLTDVATPGAANLTLVSNGSNQWTSAATIPVSAVPIIDASKISDVEPVPASTSTSDFLIGDGASGWTVTTNINSALISDVEPVAAGVAAPTLDGHVLTAAGGVWTSAAPAGGNVPDPTSVNDVVYSADGATWIRAPTIPVASVPTLTAAKISDVDPVPSAGADGQVLTAAGGNWTSAAPSGGLPVGTAGNLLVSDGASGAVVSDGRAKSLLFSARADCTGNNNSPAPFTVELDWTNGAFTEFAAPGWSLGPTGVTYPAGLDTTTLAIEIHGTFRQYGSSGVDCDVIARYNFDIPQSQRRIGELPSSGLTGYHAYFNFTPTAISDTIHVETRKTVGLAGNGIVPVDAFSFIVYKIEDGT